MQVKGYQKPGLWNRKFSLDFPRTNAELNTKMAKMMIKQGMTPEAVAGAFPNVFKMIQTDSGQIKLGMKYDVELPDGSKDVSQVVSADSAMYAIQQFKRISTNASPSFTVDSQDHLKREEREEKIVEPVVRGAVTPVAVSVPPDDYEVKEHTEAEYKKYLDSLKSNDKELEIYD